MGKELSPARAGEKAEAVGKPRILWLHTRPQHYHNCMMDDLQRAGNYEYIAAFSYPGRGWFSEENPKAVQTCYLRLKPAFENGRQNWRAACHVDWRKDLHPLKFDAAIVAGYGIRTHREVIRDCKARGIPVAIFSDSNLRNECGHAMKDWIRRAVKRRMLARHIERADYLLTANRLGIAYWRYYGAPRSKIILCPYYSDYPRVEAARAVSRVQVLQRIGLAADSRYIFTAARLASAKGLDLGIRAFIDLRLAERGWHYVIAGVGPLEASLKALAGDLLGRHIHFVGFQQPLDNAALMAHANLFLLPSVHEPHGIVVQESMAAGTPVLASDVCGAAHDLVEPGVNGELFVSGDTQSLQRKLAGMIEDPERLARMGVEAHRGFKAWFAATSPIKVVEEAVGRMLKRTVGVKAT